MLATAWHSGGSTHEPGGYGIRFSADDRDRYFNGFDDVVLELDGAGPVTIQLSPSFWRKCSELRSAEIGRWLIASEVAPWAKGNPPGIVVTPIDRNRFVARVHVRRSLGLR